ncbi:iron chelate uptake ABC transporter family permease subunit [Agrobacterium sp. FDAARGOS_525]|uniref:iron chelate uptake ABC transporter family permease subunit n=1 Tax=Agrobacterium sp. FDAARGOS_525 TaxID=2420311 RepID=UPI001AEC9D0E
MSRHPLGSPDVIGFTTGAATGALAQIVILGGGPLAVELSAVLGGLVSATLVYLLSVKQGVTGGYRLGTACHCYIGIGMLDYVEYASRLSLAEFYIIPISNSLSKEVHPCQSRIKVSRKLRHQ